MGLIVSYLRPPSPSPPPPPPRPNCIPLPAAIFGALALSPSSSPLPRTDPFDSTLDFFTAPSSPYVSPYIEAPPPPPAPPSPDLDANESYPTTAPPHLVDNLALDDDDDSLTPLERIYLFSRSKASFHRVFIAHALPSLLPSVAPPDAVDYVLPLLSGLAMDDDEPVKEALAAELVPIIWWFFTHCQLVEDDQTFVADSPPHAGTITTISVQAFTPILGTLLLSSNPLVGGPARYAIVDTLSRMRRADTPDHEAEWTGLFGRTERRLFEQEILHQVVIGMGRLDADEPAPPEEPPAPQINSPQINSGEVNPYFPVLAPAPQGPLPHINIQSATPPENVDEADDGEGAGEQAAVGRLSSMSLMAAVTASGSLDEETKTAFVKEVERVGRDSVYWVRREASFALGALAKVVPEEIVLCSLLPLFEALRHDSSHHVRHSALFALPALLSRLPPPQRRAVALATIPPLAKDTSATVRVGVLEALGEAIYAFHDAEDGVPAELVRLFVGREDRRGLDQQQQLASPTIADPEDLFFTDPARPLICAFNIPAVALALGRARWEADLRALYVRLTADRAVSVRRTLAASLGELARIVGPAAAARDLVQVWWDSARYADDGEVRLKAVECVVMFAGALAEAERWRVVEGLLEIWEEGALRGWREREAAAKELGELVALAGEKLPRVVRGLLVKGLEDEVAAVREAAVDALPGLWGVFRSRREVLDDLRGLARSSSHRKRMTYIACVQTLVTKEESINASEFWSELAVLVEDDIVGVRIGLARLVGALCATPAPPSGALELAQRLAEDKAADVRVYATRQPAAGKQPSGSATFSRPPPVEGVIGDQTVSEQEYFSVRGELEAG